MEHRGIRGVVAACAALAVAGCGEDDGVGAFPEVALPDGYRIEKVVDGLNFPTSVTWDDQGRMYVAESGSGLTPEQLAPIRILRVEGNRATPVANLDGKIKHALVGMTWHKGEFLVTHRAMDRTGAVSRVSMSGQVTKLFDGIVDSQAEHQINDIRMGPDGRAYVAVGQAANAAVMSQELAGHIKLSPGAQPRPCRDIVLTGRNFRTPDVRTEAPNDSTLTGAFVPFGTSTQPGQRVPGVTKCGGSILAFNPANPEATLQMHAWGFRNLIGLVFAPGGEMFATENGFDIRGARPVRDEAEPTLRIRQGVWYGMPDYSGLREPLTDQKFEPADSFQAPIFRGGQSIGRDLGFVIDHAASGLTAPDRNLVVGRHEFNTSPSLLDVAPASWSEFAGQLFVAEWGDLRPATNPLTDVPVGQRIVRVDPVTRQVSPFVGRRTGQITPGQGIERPFDVKFGPDGAMYIVDYGRVNVNPRQTPPYEQIPATGAVWKVTRGR